MTDKAKKLLMLYEQSGKRKTMESAPPLTFKGYGKGLKNYRIYGNTVNGESVGDRTANLFDGNTIPAYTSMSKPHIFSVDSDATAIMLETTLLPSTVTINAVNGNRCYVSYYNTYPSNRDVAELFIYVSQTLPQNITVNKSYKYIMIQVGFQVTVSNVMLNSGSTALPYEPYGYKVPVTVEGKNLFDINNLEDHYDISVETGLPVQNSPYSYSRCAITTPINVSAGDYYLTFNKNIAGEIGFIVSVFENNTLISRTSGYYFGSRIRISSGNNIYIGFHNQNVALAIHPSDISNIMLNSGSTALPYEPYHAPVTTPIYLPEQIKKVGDVAEYIDFMEQKQHFADGTSADITLPALPTLSDTNILSVGTAVQPSKVEITGKIKQI